MSNPISPDDWSTWLLRRRDGGSAAQRQSSDRAVNAIRDRVLDSAHLAPGQTFVDVGAGEGLLGFGAIDRIGPSLRVTFTDISAPLLAHLRGLADRRGVAEQCAFLHASSDRLDPLPTASADVIATRASLAYVPDKPAALAHFYRALKPGGRISLSEPINQDHALECLGLARFIQANPNHPHIEILRLRLRLAAAHFPSTPDEISSNPLTNFSERELVSFLRAARFTQIHVELHIDLVPSLVTDWQTYLETAPHPWSPTNGEVLTKTFTPAEQALFESATRPTIESGQSLSTDTTAYATATKPESEDAQLLR